MEAFDNLLQRVAEMKKEIWALEDAPEEIIALRNNKFVPSGTAPSVLYACFDVANGSTLLLLARDLLKEEENNLKECKAILKKFLLTMSGRYATWGFQKASSLLREVLDSLQDIDSRESLIRLTNELFIYNNKLWNWVDMTIPWFQLDAKLEPT